MPATQRGEAAEPSGGAELPALPRKEDSKGLSWSAGPQRVLPQRGHPRIHGEACADCSAGRGMSAALTHGFPRTGRGQG